MSRLRKGDKERHQNLCRLQKISMQDMRSQNAELLHELQAIPKFSQGERTAETGENQRRAVRGEQESDYGIREKKGAVEKMRPIDADLLLAVARDMQSETEETAYNFMNEAQNPSTEWEFVEGLIEKVPTLDVVPVVRCKDCLFSGKRRYLNDNVLYCTQFDDFMEESDFCCRAERKGCVILS